jgi:hypothetical protein
MLMEECPLFLPRWSQNMRSALCKLMAGTLCNLAFEVTRYYNERIHLVKVLTIQNGGPDLCPYQKKMETSQSYGKKNV